MPPKSAQKSGQKRKQDAPAGSSSYTSLTLKQKLDILKDHESGKLSQRKIAEKYNIGKTTVHNIVNAKEQIKEAAEDPSNLEVKRAKRTTKNGDVNAALLMFFRRCREKNFPLTEPVLVTEDEYVDLDNDL